jgi:opacity protein-like surface antigen
MKKVLFAVIALLALAMVLSADVYIKTNVHTDAFAMMGQNQPAKDEIMEQWIGNNQLVNKTGDKVMIMDMNKNMMFIVNPKEKSYVETQLPLDMAKLLPKEAASMMSMMKVTVKVTPNGQTQKVNKWNCVGYDVDMNMMMMQMKMKVWATTEVPFDWKMFSKMYANVSKMQFMDDAAIAELMKINGYQVASEMTMDMMGSKIKVTSQVTEIAQKPAPAGIYAVPAGFTKKATLSMEDMRGGK